MTWETFVLLVEILASNWCDRLPPKYFEKSCAEEIKECVLDGEDIDFCKGIYIGEKHE